MAKGYKKSPKKENPRDNEQRLFEIADAQQGFFTAKQAVTAGYSEKNHAFHVHSGNWIRELHGVYRLRSYPQSPEAHLVLWSLWSRGKDGEPQGVYSHETVLSHYNLSDVNPSHLHMTVPKEFKRSVELPKDLVLYKAVLPKSDIRPMRGYRMTTVKRALEDIVEEGELSRDLIEQAVQEALRTGHLSIAEFEKSEILRAYRTVPRSIRRREVSS
jgi:predicted transcriptional regulator of viral defense system